MEPSQQDSKSELTSPRSQQQMAKMNKLAVTNATINAVKSKSHDAAGDKAAFNNIDDSLNLLDAFITNVQVNMPETKKRNSIERRTFTGASTTQPETNTPSTLSSTTNASASTSSANVSVSSSTVNTSSTPSNGASASPTTVNTPQKSSLPTVSTTKVNTTTPATTATAASSPSVGADDEPESLPVAPLRVISAAMLDDDDLQDDPHYSSTAIPEIVARQQQQRGFSSKQYQYTPQPAPAPVQQPRKTSQPQESSSIPPMLIAAQQSQSSSTQVPSVLVTTQQSQSQSTSSQVPSILVTTQQSQSQSSSTHVPSILATAQQSQSQSQSQESSSVPPMLISAQQSQSQPLPQQPQSSEHPEADKSIFPKAHEISPTIFQTTNQQQQQQQQPQPSLQSPSQQPQPSPQPLPQESQPSPQSPPQQPQPSSQSLPQQLPQSTSSPRSKEKTWINGTIKRLVPSLPSKTEDFRCVTKTVITPTEPPSEEQGDSSEDNTEEKPVMIPENSFFKALTGVNEADFKASPEIHIVRSIEHPGDHICYRRGLLAQRQMAAWHDFEGCTFKVRSSEDGREYMAGSFHMPKLCELRDTALKTPLPLLQTESECTLYIDTNIGGDRQDDVDFGHLQTAPENRGCMFQVVTSTNALCTTGGSTTSFEGGTAISSYGFLPEPTKGAAISAAPGAIVRLYAAYFSPHGPAGEWRQTQERQLSVIDQDTPFESIRIPIQKDVEAVFGRRSGGSIEMYKVPQKISQVFLVCDDDNNSNSNNKCCDNKTILLLKAGYQGAYCAAIAVGAQKLFLTVPISQAATAAAFEEIVAAHKEFVLDGPGKNSIREVHVVVSTLDTQPLTKFVAALTKSRIPYKNNEGQLK